MVGGRGASVRGRGKPPEEARAAPRDYPFYVGRQEFRQSPSFAQYHQALKQKYADAPDLVLLAG